jgi:peptidoglycan/LPS O-acetylase OafA/YrhL
VVGLVGSEQRGLISVPTILRSLGAASYSIYLFHLPFITLVWAFWLAAGLDKSMTPSASFLPLVIGGVGGGMLMSRLVEFPLMRLLRGGFSRSQLWRQPRRIRRSPEIERWTMCHDRRPVP